MTTNDSAPLQHFRIVGIRENWFSAAPDHRQPGGSCWHCGQGIAIEVVARHSSTGETITVGTTCAERIGLDPEGLKQYLAERFAEQRAERARLNAEARRRQAEQDEAEGTGKLGPHGSESRFLSGCTCVPCLGAAPHGTAQRFGNGCRCLDCIDAYVAVDPYDRGRGRGRRFRNMTVLVDVSTGEIIEDARRVETRYGVRWRSDSRNVWLPVAPARRSTLASKGYVESEAPFLVDTYRNRRGWWDERIARVGEPVFDRWGEPVARQTRQAA